MAKSDKTTKSLWKGKNVGFISLPSSAPFIGRTVGGRGGGNTVRFVSIMGNTIKKQFRASLGNLICRIQ